MRKFFVLLLACMILAGSASAGMAIVQINEDNFPDSVFRGYIKENFDADGDGILSNNEILNAKQVFISYNYDRLRSLEGIKHLTSLEELECSSNKLTELDLSGMTSLKYVDCNYATDSRLAAINLSGCTSLQRVNCYNNGVTSINLTGCEALRELNCADNKLTSLNLKDCKSLTTLYCYNNALTELDISKCADINYVYCNDNKISALNLSNNELIEQLQCQNNRITALDVSKNQKLYQLYCDNNRLALLNVADNTNIGEGSSYACSPQHIDGLKVTNSGGIYFVNLRDYLSANVKNVLASSVYGKDSSGSFLNPSYNSSTGVMTFNVSPASVYYEYDTQYDKDETKRYMGVTIANNASPVITTASIPNGTLNVAYSFTFEADGQKPITWTIEGELPEGLTFDGGEIYGTPTTYGTFTLTVTAANDFDSETKNFTLTVSGGNVIPGDYDFSILTGTWTASNGSGTATSGDITASMSLSTTHNNTITFDNVNAGGNTASLEAVLDIYMDISGYGEWEDDFGGYKPYNTGVLTFQNIDANTWRMDRTRHNDKPTYTIITFTSSATANIERYDEYEAKLSWSYTLTKQGTPGPVTLETTKWERENGRLIVETNTGEHYEFDPLDGTNGDGFVINGVLPAGLAINLPGNWGIDIDTSYNVTVSDTGKIIPAKNIPGLPDTAHRIIGDNTITLNASGITMTAFFFNSSQHETTKWNKENDKLIAETSAGAHYEFEPLDGTNGDGFVINGELPSGLVINLPEKWGIDIDKSNNVTVSDTSKIIPASEIPGLSDTAHRIIGDNTITLNEPGIVMTAFLFTSPTILTDANLGTFSAGSDISLQLAVEGTTWTMSWSAENLPVGLSLSEGGLLTGSISSAGDYSFTVKASNVAGEDSRIFTLSVNAVSSQTTRWYKENGKLIVETNTGGHYEFEPLDGTNGDGFIINGELPSGLVINLPEKWGIDIDKSNNVTVSDTSKIIPASEIPGLSDTAHRIIGDNTITLNEPGIVMTAFLFTSPTILTDANLGTLSAGSDISLQLAVEGTTWTMSWSAENLPVGLSLSEEGLLTGNISTAGDYSFTVKASNIAGEDSRKFTLSVTSPVPGVTAPTITTETLPDATAGSVYSAKFTATGTSPITWSAKGLPDDFTLGTSSGRLTGSPALEGEYSVTVTATNLAGSSTKIFTLKVSAPKATPPEITSSSLPDATQNSSYSVQLDAQGSGLTWSQKGLPGGLTISNSGLISGTPSSAGTFRVVITVKNSAGVDTAALTLKVSSPQASTRVPTIKTATKLPEGYKSREYSYQLEADGNVTEWRIDSGTLPGDLELDASTGEISGTITTSKAANYKFKVVAVNEAGVSAARQFTLKVSGSAPGFNKSSLKTAKWGTKYSMTVKPSPSSFKAAAWGINGNLPEGITFSNGKFTGKPTEFGEFDFTLTASNGAVEIERDYVLTVNRIAPKIKGSLKSGAKEGKYYSSTIKATGTTPIDWQIDNLPEGLEFQYDETGQTCTIFGTPEEPFNSYVWVSVNNGMDDSDAVTKNLKLKVAAVKPTFATKASSVPSGTVGVAYEYQLALKAQPSKVTWTYTGNMPDGLDLDDEGLIYGTPEEAGTFKFTVKVQNANQESKYSNLKITLKIKEGNNNSLQAEMNEELPGNDAESKNFVDGVAYYERGELSAEMLARAENSGEIIAAVLPAIEVEESGRYDFTVSLDKSMEGAVLVWHSYPDGEDDPDDPDNAFFLDGDEIIGTVPASLTVTVEAWLIPGRVYEPVIAVKK